MRGAGNQRANAQHRSLNLIAACGSVIVLTSVTAGCSTPAQTYAQLEKVARGVSVPAGLTFVDFTRTQMDPGSGITYEADARYLNPSMTCTQLRAAWLAALAKAHRATDISSPPDGEVFIKSSDYTINLSFGVDPLAGDCSHPSVTAQTKQ